MIALITLISGVISPLPAEAELVSNFPFQKSPIDIRKIRVPEKIGRIQETHQGSTEQTVILIQDAHGIPDAQKNIAKLIEYFQSHYGINLVALEGVPTNSRLDPQIFRSFPDKEALKKQFEIYLQNGEVTGSTVASIFSPYSSVYFGVEDWTLYEKGLALYQQVMNQKKQIWNDLDSQKKLLQKEKEEIYSPQLFELDQALEACHKNHGDFLKALQMLSQIKEPPKGSDLELLLKQSKEKNSAQVDQEIKRIAKAMKSSFLSSQTQISFNQKYQEFLTSKIPADEFAAYLEIIVSSGKEKKRLQRFAEKYKKIQMVEGTKLFENFWEYAQEVKKSFLKSQIEKELDQKYENLKFLERLNELELTYEDWEEIKRVEKNENISKDFSNHLRFYEIAAKRDKAFLENLNSNMLQHRSSQVLFIAGGFHARSLMKNFMSKNVSYVLISPQIKTLPEYNYYQEHMRGNFSWKKYYQVESGKVNLYKSFVRATRDFLLAKAQDPQLLKKWHDQILIDLARKKKISEASEYTFFMMENELYKKETPKWRIRVNEFIEQLQSLNASDQLTQTSVLNLFKPSTQPDLSALVLSPNFLLPKFLLDPRSGNDLSQSVSRSEARTNQNQEKFDNLVELINHWTDNKEYPICQWVNDSIFTPRHKILTEVKVLGGSMKQTSTRLSDEQQKKLLATIESAISNIKNNRHLNDQRKMEALKNAARILYVNTLRYLDVPWTEQSLFSLGIHKIVTDVIYMEEGDQVGTYWGNYNVKTGRERAPAWLSFQEEMSQSTTDNPNPGIISKNVPHPEKVASNMHDAKSIPAEFEETKSRILKTFGPLNIGEVSDSDRDEKKEQFKVLFQSFVKLSDEELDQAWRRNTEILVEAAISTAFENLRQILLGNVSPSMLGYKSKAHAENGRAYFELRVSNLKQSLEIRKRPLSLDQKETLRKLAEHVLVALRAENSGELEATENVFKKQLRELGIEFVFQDESNKRRGAQEQQIVAQRSGRVNSIVEELIAHCSNKEALSLIVSRIKSDIVDLEQKLDGQKLSNQQKNEIRKAVEEVLRRYVSDSGYEAAVSVLTTRLKHLEIELSQGFSDEIKAMQSESEERRKKTVERGKDDWLSDALEKLLGILNKGVDHPDFVFRVKRQAREGFESFGDLDPVLVWSIYANHAMEGLSPIHFSENPQMQGLIEKIILATASQAALIAIDYGIGMYSKYAIPFIGKLQSIGIEVPQGEIENSINERFMGSSQPQAALAITGSSSVTWSSARLSDERVRNIVSSHMRAILNNIPDNLRELETIELEERFASLSYWREVVNQQGGSYSEAFRAAYLFFQEKNKVELELASKGKAFVTLKPHIYLVIMDNALQVPSRFKKQDIRDGDYEDWRVIFSRLYSRFKFNNQPTSNRKYTALLELRFENPDDPNINWLDIQKKYRILAIEYHPDNQTTGDAEKFMQVERAYRDLKAIKSTFEVNDNLKRSELRNQTVDSSFSLPDAVRTVIGLSKEDVIPAGSLNRTALMIVDNLEAFTEVLIVQADRVERKEQEHFVTTALNDSQNLLGALHQPINLNFVIVPEMVGKGVDTAVFVDELLKTAYQLALNPHLTVTITDTTDQELLKNVSLAVNKADGVKIMTDKTTIQFTQNVTVPDYSVTVNVSAQAEEGSKSINSLEFRDGKLDYSGNPSLGSQLLVSAAVLAGAVALNQQPSDFLVPTHNSDMFFIKSPDLLPGWTSIIMADIRSAREIQKAA